VIERCSIALLLAMAAGAAMAQKTPIYRCGQTYSQTPCPDGHLIDSADPRTAAQRAQAKRVVENEKRLAAQMERDRHAAEAASAPAIAAALTTPVAASAPASAPAKGKKKPGKADKAASGPGVVFITPRPKQ
jgi:hypothetical protein